MAIFTGARNVATTAHTTIGIFTRPIAGLRRNATFVLVKLLLKIDLSVLGFG
jgi:hypothetical protein